MNKILAGLFSVLLWFNSFSPAIAIPNMGAYTAVFSSNDLAFYFDSFPKYKTDFFYPTLSWSTLPAFLNKVKVDSGKQVIFLDFLVHGDEAGLYLHEKPHTHWYRASFGYVLNKVSSILAGKKVIICFESCLAASAYKNTIRGAKSSDPTDFIEDYIGKPAFPVWGMGDGFDSIGQMMYLQQRYNFRKWWTNLVSYDALGDNRPLVSAEKEYFEDKSPMTENIEYVWEFFAYHIP